MRQWSKPPSVQSSAGRAPPPASWSCCPGPCWSSAAAPPSRPRSSSSPARSLFHDHPENCLINIHWYIFQSIYYHVAIIISLLRSPWRRKYFKQKTSVGDCLETKRSHVQIAPFLSLQRPKDPLHFHPSGPKRLKIDLELFLFPPASFWQCPQLLLSSHLFPSASVTCREKQFMIL